MFPFYTPWKHQKTFSLLVFSGGMKWEYWPEMVNMIDMITQPAITFSKLTIETPKQGVKYVQS